MSSDCLTAVKTRTEKIGLVCVGNELMADDGVGIQLAEMLQSETLPCNVKVLEKGTSNLRVFYALSNLDKAIIVDAVDFGGQPGESRWFKLDDVVTDKNISGLSLHECDLLAIIDLFNKLGKKAPEITIYAIQPEAIAPCLTLSSQLAAKLPEFVKEIKALIPRASNRTGMVCQRTEVTETGQV